MDKTFFLIGALAGALAVALGAFGAHALRERLGPRASETFETAVRYQMYHALGLMAIAFAWTRGSADWIIWAGWAMLVGIVLFSGSLYALTLTGIRRLGLITPFGGIALLAGWLLLALGVWQGR
jgi:uncharacterized membrane protein YgdD (TMEM256/DUF423 family)